MPERGGGSLPPGLSGLPPRIFYPKRKRRKQGQTWSEPQARGQVGEAVDHLGPLGGEAGAVFGQTKAADTGVRSPETARRTVIDHDAMLGGQVQRAGGMQPETRIRLGAAEVLARVEVRLQPCQKLGVLAQGYGHLRAGSVGAHGIAGARCIEPVEQVRNPGNQANAACQPLIEPVVKIIDPIIGKIGTKVAGLGEQPPDGAADEQLVGIGPSQSKRTAFGVIARPSGW